MSAHPAAFNMVEPDRVTEPAVGDILVGLEHGDGWWRENVIEILFVSSQSILARSRFFRCNNACLEYPGREDWTRCDGHERLWSLEYRTWRRVTAAGSGHLDSVASAGQSSPQAATRTFEEAVKAISTLTNASGPVDVSQADSVRRMLFRHHVLADRRGRLWRRDDDGNAVIVPTHRVADHDLRFAGPDEVKVVGCEERYVLIWSGPYRRSMGHGETILLFDRVFTISMVEHDAQCGVVSIVAITSAGSE